MPKHINHVPLGHRIRFSLQLEKMGRHFVSVASALSALSSINASFLGNPKQVHFTVPIINSWLLALTAVHEIRGRIKLNPMVLVF